jgi:phosphatidylglycerol---prolipoprotein diacylglyceryl transferase
MDAVFLDLGIVQIQWYSIFIFLGLLFGGLIAIFESKKFGISEDFFINLFFYMVPIAIIGARLYYVAFNWEYYQANQMEIFRIWNGGLAIHGAIIFGLIWAIIYSKKYKINYLRILDIIVVGLLIGQAIGRWGNFFNQEAYGPVTTLAFLEGLRLPNFIIEGMFIGGNYHQPAFLYESIWTLIGFFAILKIRRNKYIKIGQITSFYLVWYGIGRLIIESMRLDSLMLGGIKMAQLASIVMIVGGIILFITKLRGSIFENRYNESGDINAINF